MSAFDELYQTVLASRRSQSPDDAGPQIGPLEAFDIHRIAASLDAARRNEGRPVPEHFTLPDYPGQAADLRVEGTTIGTHGLVGSGRDLVYLAQTTADGLTAPPLRVTRRSLLRDSRADAQDKATWGRELPVGVKAFDDRFLVRSRSRRAATVFLDPAVVAALTRVRRDLVHVDVRAEGGRMLVEVRVSVGSARDAEDAVSLARVAHAAALRLAHTPGGFADEAQARKLSAEALKLLVERVQQSTSFLAGHVERQGDGIEARFELDRPEGLRGVLRIEPVDEDAVRASLRGALLAPPDTRATLSPEVGVLQRARGLFDPKVGNEALDKAFLIEGKVEVARIALADPHAALRLAGRMSTLTVDGEGLSIVVPSFTADEASFLEVTAASVAAWREAALQNAGFKEYAVAND